MSIKNKKFKINNIKDKLLIILGIISFTYLMLIIFNIVLHMTGVQFPKQIYISIPLFILGISCFTTFVIEPIVDWIFD